MEITKPRFGSSLVRNAFFQHYESINDGKRPQERHLRATAISKQFAAIVHKRLFGSELRLVDIESESCECQFQNLTHEWWTQKEAILLLAFARPKISKLVLLTEDAKSTIEKQLIEFLVGIPNLVICSEKENRNLIALLKKMAPHLLNLECSYSYLNSNLPQMRLNTYSNSSFERLEFDFGPFLAKHQVRQIRLTTVRHSLSQVNCRSHSINSSVEKIVLNTTADLSFTRLSMDFLKTARNLKFVLYHFVIYPKLEHLEDLLYNLIDYVRGCLQQSPNLQFIFDIQVKSRDLNDLGCPQFFLGKEHKFVQKKELKDDVDFKSSRNYECEEEMQILVCTANRVKFFIWC